MQNMMMLVLMFVITLLLITDVDNGFMLAAHICNCDVCVHVYCALDSLGWTFVNISFT
jgi:hypothetical protein